MRVYWLRNIVLSIPPIMCYTVRKGRRRQKNVHYNFNLGDVLCGEPDLRYTFTCTAAHCTGQTKKRAAICSGQYGFVLTGVARADFRVQCPRICTGFQRPSGYIVRYSVLRSRTVPVGGCCKCRRMHVPDETQRKITPATSIYYSQYTIKPKPPFQAVLLF